MSMTSSPTSASAIACRIPAVGFVTVSLRKSIISGFVSMVYWSFLIGASNFPVPVSKNLVVSLMLKAGEVVFSCKIAGKHKPS